MDSPYECTRNKKKIIDRSGKIAYPLREQCYRVVIFRYLSPVRETREHCEMKDADRSSIQDSVGIDRERSSELKRNTRKNITHSTDIRNKKVEMQKRKELI